MTQPNDIKVNYAELMDKSGADITQMLKNKEIDLISATPEERANLLKFGSLEANSEERKQMLEELGLSSGKPDDGVDDGTGEKPAGEADDGEPSDDGKPSDEPSAGDELLGYESTEDLLKAHKKMLSDMADLNNQVTTHRSANGRLGAENAQIKKTLDELNSKVKDLEVKAKGPAVEKPTRPKMPKPSDFEDGNLDAGYASAMDQYATDVETFEANYELYLESREPETLTALKNQIDEVQSKADTAFSFANDSSQSNAQTQESTAWNGLWSDTEKLQEEFGLPTSAPMKDINPFALIVKNAGVKDADGNLIHTPEEIAQAKSYMDNLSPVDRTNFQKMAKLVSAMYNFDSGAPERIFKNPKSAILEYGLEKEFPSLKKVKPTLRDDALALAESQRKKDDAPASMAGKDIGGDTNDLDEMGHADLLARMKELIAMRKANTRSFAANADLMKEFREIAGKLNMHVPAKS